MSAVSSAGDWEAGCEMTLALMVAACALAGGVVARGVRSAWKRRARR
ncbi:MAG: hypothetical protein ACRDNT_28030 [Streptosporangiaceae bacterium]